MMKMCTCCESVFTEEMWQQLQFVGVQETEDETGQFIFILELRNCPCGSTIGLEEKVDKITPYYDRPSMHYLESQ